MDARFGREKAATEPGRGRLNFKQVLVARHGKPAELPECATPGTAMSAFYRSAGRRIIRALIRDAKAITARADNLKFLANGTSNSCLQVALLENEVANRNMVPDRFAWFGRDHEKVIIFEHM